MNPANKNAQSTQLPRPSHARPALPASTGGVPLSTLSNSAKARRLAIKRQSIHPKTARAATFLAGAAGNSSPGTTARPKKPTSDATAEVDHRREMGRILNLLLADEYRLYEITRDYHWNVTGPDFFSLQLLFQLLHDETAGWADALAERVRSLGLERQVSWTELQATTRCSAAPGFGLNAGGMLSELLAAYDEIMAQLRLDSEVCRISYGDTATAGFLTDLREQHENAAWMLRAQLGTMDKMQPVAH